MQSGNAQAGRILDGEWWRSVTALTLHANLPHALSNAVALAVFFGAASGQIGVGATSLLVLLAGAGGNLANAFLRGGLHTSVGASTAIFAAVGLLGSLAIFQRYQNAASRRRAWVAIAAALALLGMLGTGGGRVDVVAHLLGFVTGSVLGVPMALMCPDLLPRLVQWLCGSATIGVLVLCWTLALGI
jgi:membrane associated rhomboid family serine protease